MIHQAIIDRIKELSDLAESYHEAANLITRIKNLEVELKMPNAVVMDRAEKEKRLAQLKQDFNDLNITHLFSSKL